MLSLQICLSLAILFDCLVWPLVDQMPKRSRSEGTFYDWRMKFLIIIYYSKLMSGRIFSIIVFLIAVFVIVRRDQSAHLVTKHSPAPAVTLSTSQSARPYYTTGPLRQVALPKPTLLDALVRKKIDNFVFNHYNHYKLEFTFVDLGYASNFMFSFFSEEYPAYRITEKIGFDLQENMLDGLNLDIRKRNFNLTVRQHIDAVTDETITTFNISLFRHQSNLNANLTHIIRNEQCFTAIRKSNTISHKCYGGIGSGKVKIDRILRENLQAKKQSNMLNPTFNLTRAVYDGLRGSGMHWRWVWGMMSGFSKPLFYSLNHTIPTEHWLGLNFGHLSDQGEDFAFINGKIIPIEGLAYQFNEKVKQGTNITITASKPSLFANFTVISVHHQLEDLGVIKVDMVKAEGNWAGWIKDQQGNKFEFYLIAGHIESSDSLF